jgi:hypothetical protein
MRKLLLFAAGWNTTIARDVVRARSSSSGPVGIGWT